MSHKTTYSQSLMHMIKGNLGAGLMAMPASFAHTGLVGALVGLPALCIISGYCVHALVRSSHHVESKTKTHVPDYSNLGRKAVEVGPERTRPLAGCLSYLIDTALLTTQIGVCCVYIVFVVDNIVSILASYDIAVSKSLVFAAILPFMVALNLVRTLKRLAIASAIGNALQVLGLVFVIEYLIRDYDKVRVVDRDLYRPLNEMALGFGSIMFAFEGISIVLPIYTGMIEQHLMYSCAGVVNIAFTLILTLYFVMGFFGFMKFGHNAKDSVTLNLPAEPLYDFVRALFTTSIFLSYPLQFYVPNQIIWKWARTNLLKPTSLPKNRNIPALSNIEVVIPSAKVVSEKISTDLNGNLGNKRSTNDNDNQNIKDNSSIRTISNPIRAAEQKLKSPLEPTLIHHIPIVKSQQEVLAEDIVSIRGDGSVNDQIDVEYPLRYEYCSRAALVLFTFTLAFTVPKLNLLMDLIGSFSGALLCLTIPAILHLVTFWDSLRGFKALIVITIDVALIIFSVVAGAYGSLSSLSFIVASFGLDK